MIKLLNSIITGSFLLLFSITGHSVPPVTGSPIIVQHLGKIEWPQDNPTITPYLTQLAANDINDLHGELSCDLIISTPGNYHMALKDALYGRADLEHPGLITQANTHSHNKTSICWSTSPPISIDQIQAEKLQFKNITMIGRPSLVVAPGMLMNRLVSNAQVDESSRQSILSNKGNVILVRRDKTNDIKDICDLGKTTRVVTPHPDLEPGSFGNFSGTLFNVVDQNKDLFDCNASNLFNSIFSQDISEFDLSAFKNPYDINSVLSVFGRGSKAQGSGPKWVASSRIMHRDLPYALCHDEADAGIIFYHQAIFIKHTLAKSGCNLDIIPLGGTVSNPVPLPGNRVGTLHIAKVRGNFNGKTMHVRNMIYNFLTSDPLWEQILNDHGMVR